MGFLDLSKGFLEFYRVGDWFHLLSLSVLGLVLALPSYSFWLSIVCLIQVSLVHMNAFSMNDYYDYIFQGEENFTGLFIEDYGFLTGSLMLFWPLIVCMAFLPFTGFYTLLLLAYPFVAYLYQRPLRWKDNLVLGFFLNGVSSFLFCFILFWL